MPKRRRAVPEEVVERRPKKVYRIKEEKDLGFGKFNLYCDGDWLETFRTRDEAVAEETCRKEADMILGK